MDLIFDTETTGLSGDARIMQLSMILVDEKRRVVSIFKCHVKPPEGGFQIHPKALETHGITNEDCERFGLPIKSVLQLFFNWAKKANTLVGFNVDYDIKRVEFESQINDVPITFPPETHCVMQAAIPHCQLPGGPHGTFKWPKLADAHKHYTGKDIEGAHDAFNDVKATARCFYHQKNLAMKEGAEKND